MNYSSFTQVLLSTALINAKNCQGVAQTCRALLDSDSQSNFTTEDLVRCLDLTNIPVIGINQSWNRTQEMVKINIISKHHAFNVTVDCLVLKQINDRLPNFPLDRASVKLLQNLR